MGKVFLNSGIVDEAQACVSALDSGFLYGLGLFETMRAVGGEVFALDDHLARLAASAVALQVQNPYEKSFLADAVRQTLEANSLQEARVRLTLSGGPMNAEPPAATLFVTATGLDSYPKECYEKGVTAVISDYRQNPQDPATGHKTISFFSRLLALREAHCKHATEALWFTPQGLLAEGCISNVFIVRDSTLFTPKRETPVMPGVARKHILRLAGTLGIGAEERDLTVSDLLKADEVFVSNVIMLLLPVVAVEAHAVGEGRPGPVTKKLLEAFRGLVQPKGTAAGGN